MSELAELRESVVGILGTCPGPRDPADPTLWPRLVEEQGWPALAIPEEHGGWGFTLAELVVVLEELGRTLVPTPLVETMLAASVLLDADHEALSDIAEGAAAAIVESGHVLGTPSLVVLQQDGVWSLSRDFTLTPAHHLDPLRALHAIQVHSSEPLATDEPLVFAWIALAAELLGCAQASLDMAVEYAKVREQFGRPIGSFQAIKHLCADLLLEVESARSAVYAAAQSLDPLTARTALVRAKEAAWQAGAQNIQVHGGIGFTTECDAHFHFKRARALKHTLGSPSEHRAVIARAALSGSSALPDRSLSDEDEAWRQHCRSWLEENLSGDFAQLRGRGWPGDMDSLIEERRAWDRRLNEGGFSGLNWAKPWGQGSTLAQEVIFHEEYARARAPGRVAHIGEGLLGPTLIAFGTEEQKARFLPRILDGSELWCQGYSEPNAGSDLANVQCKAELRDGQWRITGQKVWTSLAACSDWCFVLCHTSNPAKKHRGITYLLVPMDQPGVSIVPIEQISGGEEFAEVFFDDAVTDADNVVGKVDGGWAVAMGTLAFERGASTLAQQLAFANELSDVIDAAVETGTAQDPAIAHRIAEAWMGLRVMRLNALRVLAHEGSDLTREGLITKLYWANWHRDLGELAMDVLGPHAASTGGDLERLFLWTRCDTIYAGTNEIQRNIIGERGLGLPREPR